MRTTQRFLLSYFGLTLDKNTNTHPESKDFLWGQDLSTRTDNVSQDSPWWTHIYTLKISVQILRSRQNQKRKKGHLPLWLGLIRVHKAHRCAANREDKSYTKNVAVHRALPSLTAMSQQSQFWRVLGQLCTQQPEVFPLPASKKRIKSSEYLHCLAFSSLLGSLLAVTPDIWSMHILLHSCISELQKYSCVWGTIWATICR